MQTSAGASGDVTERTMRFGQSAAEAVIAAIAASQIPRNARAVSKQ